MVGRKALTAADVGVQPQQPGKQSKFADRIGRRRPEEHRRPIKVCRQGQGCDSVQGTRLHLRRLAALERPGSFPRRSGPGSRTSRSSQNPNPSARDRSRRLSALQPAVLRPLQEHELLEEGLSEDPVRRADRRLVERRGAPAADQRPGRLGAQLLSERRDRPTRRDPEHYQELVLTTNLPGRRCSSTLTEYPYSIPAFRKAVSLAVDRKTVSKLGEYGYAPPTNALGIEFMYPKWIDPALKARAKAMAAYAPDGREEDLHRRRVHVQERRPVRPEGRSRAVPDPRDRRVVRLGRVAPDHHAQPA